MFGHTCGFGVFMEDFKEKLLGLASVLRDTGIWSHSSFPLAPICQVAALLGALEQIGTGRVSGVCTFL